MFNVLIKWKANENTLLYKTLQFSKIIFPNIIKIAHCKKYLNVP